MTFEIKFDYRFDRLGFFTPEKRAILDLAANIWGSYIQDDFTSIPAGETLRFSIDGKEREVKYNEPIDDLLIFVSSVELNSEQATLGEGAFYGDFVVDSDRAKRIQGDDFEPWLGTIEFNTAAIDNFYFDATPATADDIPFDQQDFLSLSLHEIGHVLGIGISDAFSKKVTNGKFTGTNSVKLNGGQPVPLDNDENHIQDGYTLDPDADALLDKSFTFGERNLPTDLDLAMLADIGYDVFAYDATPVHRFFQYQKGFHFYTADENEKQNVIDRSDNNELQYNYESVAYRVLSQNVDTLTGAKIDGALPVYRFFNRQTGAHLYTIDENEKNFIIDNLSNYNFENIAYYAFASEPENIETIPLYRMLNTQSGSHLFTSDRHEFDTIDTNLPHFQVEGNGGVTFYVLESI
ncbi:MAG: hypothetical protein ACRC80_34770 [Waterburya sp.]